ncbi:MAG: TerB N-terminal domain-containing protein, partial [Acidimicrobiaceae bacterium]|nr:TerB N-terminal domain-containing protein [Acidimicrobiaceae bacterium]
MKIKGLIIRGGLLYVGRRLDPAGFGREVEPALIDPSLPVHLSEPDMAGSSLGYNLSYSRISPRARAGYLHWLWTGRKEPGAPIGYVYLYFFGLERRILHDRVMLSTHPTELPAIRTEVERLRSIYGTNERFGIQAGRFAESLEVLARLDSPAPGPIPPPAPGTGELPAVFRLELGRLAAGEGRLPPDWALAWVRQAPEIRLRTPAERCGEEFDRLFLLRYRSRFGAGLALADGAPTLRLYYRPASPSFTGEVRLPVGDFPDPSIARGPTRKLAELARSISHELGPYSRLVGKHPEQRGSLAALCLLPPEMAAGGEAEAADGLVERAEAALDGAERSLVDARELTSGWPERHAGRFDREQATTVARILEGRGIGIEPDVRFGGPPLGDGPAVLFRSRSPEAGERGSPVTVPAATALVRLIALVAGATGDQNPRAETAGTLGEKVVARFDSLPLSRERVAAQLWWALRTRPGASGLKRRLATLDERSRLTAGTQLVSLAAGSGRIGPAQMAALTEAFRVLGLVPEDLFSRVHQVTVEPSSAGPAASPSPAGAAATLDTERIRSRLAETADVAAFLGEIFVDDDPPVPTAPTAPTTPTATSPAAAPPTSPGAGPLAGLDAPHSGLLRRLAVRSSWSRVEFVGL